MQTKHHSIISTADMLKCCLLNYSDNNSWMRNTVNSYIKSPLRKTTIKCYQADKNGSGFWEKEDQGFIGFYSTACNIMYKYVSSWNFHDQLCTSARIKIQVLPLGPHIWLYMAGMNGFWKLAVMKLTGVILGNILVMVFGVVLLESLELSSEYPLVACLTITLSEVFTLHNQYL